MNNIGALALMIPVVTSVCKVNGLDSRKILMPVSFSALLGGLCSVIGTPANLIVSNQLAAAKGQGFAFFDFAWVGFPAALAGILALLFWARRVLGQNVDGPGRMPPQFFRNVASEVKVPAGSKLIGLPIVKAGLTVHAMRRGGVNIFHQHPGTNIESGDILLIEISLPRLESLLTDGSVALPDATPGSALRQRVEAVIMPESTLLGSRVGTLELLHSRGIDVIAVAMQTPRIEGSFSELRLSIGDVLYLSGEQEAIDDAVNEADILPLWPKPETGDTDIRWPPAAVFAGGICLAAFDLAPPQLAFGLVVIVLAGIGSLDLRKGLADLNWPILLLLATMIPLGEAVETSGAAAILANNLVSVLPSDNPFIVEVAMMALAIVITPFVNNASAALVLGPIALGVSNATGIPPEPLLIAVALGASVDFLTPIGHHNNTLVMGIAGYRFGDFLKAGWPVTIVVTLIAALSLWLWWA